MKILVLLFIGSLQITSYRSVPNQTDSSPWLTSIGERVTIHGCAASQDLLWPNGPLHYGDLIEVEGFGYYFVNDCMHKRIKKAIDIWVPTKTEEQRIGISNRKVWRVK